MLKVMRRTSIYIDDEKLAEVQRVLGTKGLKETVDRAFDEVIKAELRRQLAERIRTGEGFDRGPEILEQTRAPRRFE
jgi:Arc/MetJ family transcription regulator